ncbi:MAG: nucleoside deaminase [Candidatus Nomurabacteria bacterium]|nr:nucleoside deaminase [Candidatus Nomurabacteria bacterium]
MKEITQFDKECFEKAISIAREIHANGGCPVGAVLAIDEKILAIGGNERHKLEKKSYINHAENLLIIKNGNVLHDANKQNKKISLYSTLEPCLQCLGTAVINHIDRILFIESDPNGGACNLKHDNIGVWYKEVWPEIIHCPFTDEPKKLMIKFFHEEIERGHIDLPNKMLKLFNAKDDNANMV